MAIVTLLLSCSNDEPNPGEEIFLGMTSYGGTNDIGVIFSVQADGTEMTILHNFSTSDGASPQGSLVKGSNDKFYGMASSGGAGNHGVIFEYDYATNTYTKKLDFTGKDGAVMGSRPYGNLTLFNNKFYGVTWSGGLNDVGVIFEYDPSTNSYSKKIDLNGATGYFSSSTLTLYNTKLYGLTILGGTSTRGTLFEFDPINGSILKKVDFTDELGGSPRGSLTVLNNKLYGATSGHLFEFDLSTNTFTQKLQFTGTDGAVMGNSPVGNILLIDGKLYGMTGVGGTNDMGVLFEYNPTNSSYSAKLNFSGTTGAVKGSYPSGGITVGRSGKYYGMTNAGGLSDLGVLFEYSPSESNYVVKHEFSGTLNGSYPSGSLLAITVK